MARTLAALSLACFLVGSAWAADVNVSIPEVDTAPLPKPGSQTLWGQFSRWLDKQGRPYNLSGNMVLTIIMMVVGRIAFQVWVHRAKKAEEAKEEAAKPVTTSGNGNAASNATVGKTSNQATPTSAGRAAAKSGGDPTAGSAEDKSNVPQSTSVDFRIGDSAEVFWDDEWRGCKIVGRGANPNQYRIEIDPDSHPMGYMYEGQHIEVPSPELTALRKPAPVEKAEDKKGK